MAVSFPASPAMSSTMVPIPYCQSIKDYTCLNIEMRKVFYEINENCPKYCYIMEYTGKRTFMLETDNNTKYEKTWYYIFSSKEVQVQGTTLLDLSDLLMEHWDYLLDFLSVMLLIWF